MVALSREDVKKKQDAWPFRHEASRNDLIGGVFRIVTVLFLRNEARGEEEEEEEDKRRVREDEGGGGKGGRDGATACASRRACSRCLSRTRHICWVAVALCGMETMWEQAGATVAAAVVAASVCSCGGGGGRR